MWPVSFTYVMCAAFMATLWTSAALPRSRFTVRATISPDIAVTLQRGVVVPFGRQAFLLPLEQLDRRDDFAPRLRRVDHGVDRAALGGRPRAQQPVLVLEL